MAVAALAVTVVALQAANLRVSASRDRARESFAEAKLQRDIAEKSRGWARDTVREYCVLVSEETLLKQPGMHRLREELLQKALTYYQRFLEEREQDPTLREEVAQAYYFIGKITREIDSPANALPYYERAAELQEQLLEADKDNQLLRASYGTTLNAMGDATLRLNEIQQAKQHFEKAITVRQIVAKAQPKDGEAARTLANSVMNSGYICYAQGDFDQAIELMKQSQAIRMAHVTQAKEVQPKLQSDLGKGYYLLAITSKAQGNLVNSEANFIQAIEIFSELLQESPNNLTLQRNLAASQRMLGDLNRDAQKAEQAIAYYQTARESLEQLKSRSPDVLQYSSDLAGVCLNLGIELEGQQQPDQALIYLERAATLLQDLAEQADMVPNYRFDLGIALTAMGKLQAKSGEVEEARKHLEEAKLVLARLVSEDPTNEQYAMEMGLAIDALAGLEAAKAEKSDEESP